MLDGHKNSFPEASRRAGVVSRKSMRIDFTRAALNDADVWEYYIQTPIFKFLMLRSAA